MKVLVFFFCFTNAGQLRLVSPHDAIDNGVVAIAIPSLRSLRVADGAPKPA